MNFYIDPGTGSMLFTILIGVLGAGVYSCRKLFMKLRFVLTGGKNKKSGNKKIPYVIFADHKRYWNVFAPICREMDRRGLEAVYMTASPDDPALKEQFTHVKCQFIGEGNKAYAKLNMLRADVLLATTPGLDVYQWKRSKEVGHYAHILHMVSDATLYRMFGLDYYDSVLLSGQYQVNQIRQLENLRSLPAKELPLVGQPYMDELLKRRQNSPKQEHHDITVLLAPSWGKNSILNKYGEKAIQALVETGYKIIVRPHPQSFTSEKELMDNLMEKFPTVEWNRDQDNFQVLECSDIMISDFSGVMFDFALVFQKPVIYADIDFDTALYDACWLEEKPWTFRILPQIGVPLPEDGMNHVKELIDKCLHDDRYQKGLEQARQESWCHIGESAKLTVDFLMEKRAHLLENNQKEQKNV